MVLLHAVVRFFCSSGSIVNNELFGNKEQPYRKRYSVHRFKIHGLSYKFNVFGSFHLCGLVWIVFNSNIRLITLRFSFTFPKTNRKALGSNMLLHRPPKSIIELPNLLTVLSFFCANSCMRNIMSLIGKACLNLLEKFNGIFAHVKRLIQLYETLAN